MKFRNFLFLGLLALLGVFLAQAPTLAGALVAALALFVVSALLSRPTPQLFATLSATEILQDTLEAFKTRVPMLSRFSTNFGPGEARKGDVIQAHVRTLPGVEDYDATTGYKANADEASGLLTDVGVTLNQHKHVPVKLDYIDSISSRKDLYAKVIGDQAYVLGKSIVDYALGLCTSANVTHGTANPALNWTNESIEAVRTQLNTQKASPTGRWGVIAPAVAAALANDVRCTSKDYYGQLQGSNAYRHFRGVGGFEDIWEYPELASTAAGQATCNGVFGDASLVAVATRIPRMMDPASLGIPNIAAWETATDPDSGLSLLGIRWVDPGTFDIYLTMTLLYGASVGAQGGGANAKTDQGGYRTTES